MNKLDEYLSILSKLRQYKYKEFIADPEHYGSAERFLHLTIEAIIDMGNRIIADLGLGVVNCYADIPSIIAEKGYIDTDMREKWIRMIGFRNTLVHDYIDIDLRIVYDVLQDNIADIEKLRTVFARFL